LLNTSCFSASYWQKCAHVFCLSEFSPLKFTSTEDIKHGYCIVTTNIIKLTIKGAKLLSFQRCFYLQAYSSSWSTRLWENNPVKGTGWKTRAVSQGLYFKHKITDWNYRIKSLSSSIFCIWVLIVIYIANMIEYNLD